MHYVRSILRVLAVSSLLPAAAIAQGTITGTVREAGSGRALFGARVTVIGTQISAGTNEQGAYTLRNVPTGTIEVRALAIGHGSQRQTIALGSGASATLDFSLPAVAIQLSDVVTTATGEQRRLEVGSDIARVNAAQLVADQPIKNVADLLTARAPGVQVTPGTITGTQSRIRIRGTNSLSLNNDPIYIIDGIRM